MEITVISEEENPMLHRTDVRFRVSHAEATPDRLAIRDSLAARLNKNADEVVVRKLDTKFGMRETIGEAKVYQGAGYANDVEQDYQLSRNKIGEDVEEDGAPEAEEAEADAEPEPETELEEEAADEAAPEADAGEAADEDEPEEAEAEEAEDGAEAAEDGAEAAEDGAEAAEDEEEAAEAEADDEETEE